MSLCRPQIPECVGHADGVVAERLHRPAGRASVRQRRLALLRRVGQQRLPGAGRERRGAGPDGVVARAAGGSVEQRLRRRRRHVPGRHRLAQASSAQPRRQVPHRRVQVRRGRDQHPAVPPALPRQQVESELVHAPLQQAGGRVRQPAHGARRLPDAEDVVVAAHLRQTVELARRLQRPAHYHPDCADARHHGIPVHDAELDRRARLPAPAVEGAVHPVDADDDVLPNDALLDAAVRLRRRDSAHRHRPDALPRVFRAAARRRARPRER